MITTYASNDIIIVVVCKFANLSSLLTEKLNQNRHTNTHIKSQEKVLNTIWWNCAIKQMILCFVPHKNSLTHAQEAITYKLEKKQHWKCKYMHYVRMFIEKLSRPQKEIKQNTESKRCHLTRLVRFSCRFYGLVKCGILFDRCWSRLVMKVNYVYCTICPARSKSTSNNKKNISTTTTTTIYSYNNTIEWQYWNLTNHPNKKWTANRKTFHIDI